MVCSGGGVKIKRGVKLSVIYRNFLVSLCVFLFLRETDRFLESFRSSVFTINLKPVPRVFARTWLSQDHPQAPD
jgi:hypothetical protein